ncbi:hypothetical protein H8958_018765 [Nasalis larvatus]
MVKPLGLLGKKVNATSTWGELTQTLGEAGRDLRMLLLDIKPQIKTSGPSTLQVEMFCQRKAERCTGASWQFAINGEKSLILDAMKMTWTVINHEASKIKETWKKDSGLEKYFRKLSVGDCNHWLREFSEHWEAMPEPTVSPVNASDIHGSYSSLPDTWIIPGAFILLVLMGIFLIIYIRWQKRRKIHLEVIPRRRRGVVHLWSSIADSLGSHCSVFPESSGVTNPLPRLDGAD